MSRQSIYKLIIAVLVVFVLLLVVGMGLGRMTRDYLGNLTGTAPKGNTTQTTPRPQSPTDAARKAVDLVNSAQRAATVE